MIRKGYTSLRKAFSHPAICAGVILALILLAETMAILILNRGMFCYSLDDPYIHLRLAQNIIRGSYGLNLGEPSSPSSSILWPFLLAIFAALRVEYFAPLVINVAAAFASLAVIREILRAALGERSEKAMVRKHALLLFFLALGLNIVGLVFIGMEHSLQVLCAMLVVAGLIREKETGRMTWWLAAGIVIGPLLRYENLFLSLPALLYLLERKHIRASILLGTILAALLAAFSAFLYSQGLGFLPASILAKSSALIAAGGTDFTGRFLLIFQRRESGLLAAGVLLLLLPMFSGKTRDPESVFCATIGIAGVLHLLFGDYGWFARYEIYIWAAVVLALFYHYRATIAGWLESVSAPSLAAVLSLAVMLLCPAYLTALLNTPRSAQNIYLQQYQMHRLAADTLHEPVGANDLGWVAYQNDQYVLDLIGLSLPDLARTEYRALPGEWLEKRTVEEGVRLVMIYNDWVPQRPESWVLLARLRFTVPRIFVASDTVSLYATAPEFTSSLRETLIGFRESLPDGAVLDMEP